MDVIDLLLLFQTRGQGAYFGEAVSEAEHALQTAHLAEEAGVCDSLVAAALLHDVGHLLHGLPEDVAERGTDGRHEDVGAAWLGRHFGQAVVAPVRLHVAAKRYLCAVDPGYLAGLSAASRLSLSLQGGLPDADEVRRLREQPHFDDALALRRWDDAAKVPGLAVPGFLHYRPRLERLLQGGQR